MIDVIEIVKPLLLFEDEDDFYYLQIIQRKKENKNLNSNSKIIKNYYVSSMEYLETKYDEIKTLCNTFNARACLRLNKRSFEKVAFKTLQNIANTMSNKDYLHIRKSYDRACGVSHNERNKKWIIDIDKNEMIWLEQVINALQICQPVGNKIIIQLPTKSGVHLITKPFNVIQFKENFEAELRTYSMSNINIDIHKDNPINLYIP